MQDLSGWHERWATGELGWHRTDPNPLLVAHARPEWRRVLVPLCGASVDLGWLVDSGREVLGLDISRVAADRVFASRNETPTVTQAGAFSVLQAGRLTYAVGDFFELDATLAAGADAVWDRAALIAVPPELRPRYVEVLRAAAPGADVLLAVIDYERGLIPGPPHAVGPDEVLDLYPGAQLVAEDDISAELNARGREGTFTQRAYRATL